MNCNNKFKSPPPMRAENELDDLADVSHLEDVRERTHVVDIGQRSDHLGLVSGNFLVVI